MSAAAGKARRRKLLWATGTAVAFTGAALFLILLAGPAFADNCSLSINPGDCQNTAWTVGAVAATAAAATAAAAATGVIGRRPEGVEAPAEAEEAGAEAPAEGPTDVILDGPAALHVLEASGLIRAVPQPDGTVVYRPAAGFEELDGGQVRVRVGEAIDPTTGRVTDVQDATITRISGIGYTRRPDGSLGENVVIIVRRTPPGPWQALSHYAPGVDIQGSRAFVDQVTGHLNTIRGTPSGRRILGNIGRSGQTVSVIEAPAGEGNSYQAARPHDRFRNPAGTRGRGTGGDVGFDPTSSGIGDGSQPWHDRPPDVGLAHELAHARDAARGQMDRGRAMDPGAPARPADPDAWRVNRRELQATSIGPYAGSSSDENAYRRERGQPHRDSYIL